MEILNEKKSMVKYQSRKNGEQNHCAIHICKHENETNNNPKIELR